jgi:hypothetical protein
MYFDHSTDGVGPINSEVDDVAVVFPNPCVSTAVKDRLQQVVKVASALVWAVGLDLHAKLALVVF